VNKRVILIAFIFAGLSGLMASCEILDECGTCEMVTIDVNNNESRSTPLPFCGEELKSKKDSSPETIGGVTTYWECY
jgi:hypothetical protein